MTTALKTALAAALVLTCVPQTAQAQSVPSAPAERLCEGPTTSVAWGAVVRDRRGPCRPSTPQPGVSARTHAVSVTAAAMPCRNARRWLGGAVQICSDRSAPEVGR